jgi:hypothetical protein
MYTKAFVLAILVVPSITVSALAQTGIQAISSGARKINTTKTPTSGTGEVYAHTEANNNVTDQTTKVTGAGAGAVAAAGTGQISNWIGIPNIYSYMTYGPFNKGLGTIIDLDSLSNGNVNPKGVAHGNGLLAVQSDGTTFLQGLAEVTNNKLAFGRARDPWNFDIEGLELNTITDTLESLSLRATPGSIGSEFFMSMESTLPGLASLYTLNVFAPAGIDSIDDLTIKFVSNPNLGFDDSSVEEDLRTRFAIDDYAATLDDPISLEFTIYGGGEYSLGAELDVGAAADTPEPTTLIIWLLLGVTGIAMGRWHSRLVFGAQSHAPVER